MRDLSKPLAPTFGNPIKKRKVVKTVNPNGRTKKVITRRDGTVVTKIKDKNSPLGSRKSKRVTKPDGTSKTKSTVDSRNIKNPGAAKIVQKSKTTYNADGSIKKTKSRVNTGPLTKTTKSKVVYNKDGSVKKSKHKPRM